MILKKVAAIVSAAAVALALTGCGKNETPYGGNTTQSGGTAANSNGNNPGNPLGSGNNAPITQLPDRLWEVIPEIPETEESAFTYDYNSELGGMVVKDYTGQSEKVRIPGVLGGKPVVKVELEQCNKKLSELVMPNSVKSFVLSASTKETLQYVNVPAAITEINGGLFNKMYGNEFDDCCEMLTGVFIPDSVTKLGLYAFGGCESLTSITIPDSVTEIDDEAFYACTDLTSVEYKGKTYDSDHFRWLYDAINLGESGFRVSAGVLEGVSIEFTVFVIPDSVIKIGDRAFGGCKNLTSITIPDSVTWIGDYAFNGCSSLTSITIPKSVTKIGARAFGGCTGLTSITIPDSVTRIDYNTFDGYENFYVIYKGEAYNNVNIHELYKAINSN